MSRTWNKTCEDCGEKYETRGARQRQCDPCWGKAMGAVRVEYLPANGGKEVARTAIIVCRECDTEYATRKKNPKRPGLCNKCSRAAGMRTPEARAKLSAAHSGKVLTPEHREKIGAASRGRKRQPHSAETRAKISASKTGKKMSPEVCAKNAEAQRGRKHSPETRAKIAAAQRGKKRAPETRAKVAAAVKAAHHERRQRGISQGGKYGWLYVVSGPGQVKVGASMDEKTLAGRLASHEKNGLTEVHATWQVDPEHGSRIEAAAVAAALAEWEQVGTTIRPDGGTETVWCDAPEAIVALVEEIIASV